MSQFKFLDQTFDMDMSVMQMDMVAVDLVFLLKHSGLSRKELADKLNCPKSRITKILSGDENLTIKTITQVAEVLGYAFDVVFYNKNYPRPKQPWQIDREKKAVAIEALESKSSTNFNILTGDEVFNDLMQGREADFYIPIPTDKTISIRTIGPKPTASIARSINALGSSNSIPPIELSVSKFNIKVVNHEQR